MASNPYPVVYPYHHAASAEPSHDPNYLAMAKMSISQAPSQATAHYSPLTATTHPMTLPITSHSLPTSVLSPTRKRTRASPEQLNILEKTFSINPSPNNRMREHLSLQLGMSERSIQIWFQNRRAKVKNMAKRSNMIQDQMLKMQQVAATAAAAACQAADYQQQQSSPEETASPSAPGPINPDLYYYYYYYYYNQQQQLVSKQGAADAQRLKQPMQPPPPPPPLSMVTATPASAKDDADVSALRLAAGKPPPPPLPPSLPLTIPVADTSSSTTSSPSHSSANATTPLATPSNPWINAVPSPLSLTAQHSFSMNSGRTRAHSVGPSFHVGVKDIYDQDGRHASLGPSISSSATSQSHWIGTSPLAEGPTGHGLRIDTNLLPSYSSSWTEDLPYSCPLPTTGDSSYSSQLDTPTLYFVDDEDDPLSSATSQRLMLSAESLQIGTWKRMALRPHDLTCYIQEDMLTWRIQDGSQSFKMEFRLDGVQHLGLMPLHNPLGWARLQIKVSDPTTIQFSMLSSQTGCWVTCHDFTQDTQATLVCIQHIEGPESLLRAELDRAAAVNSLLHSRLVHYPLPVVDETFKTLSPPIDPLLQQEDLDPSELLIFQDITHPV